MLKIQGQLVTMDDIGRGVIYVPAHGTRESGRIKSFNDRFIFVDYGYNVKGTYPRDLEWEHGKIESESI